MEGLNIPADFAYSFAQSNPNASNEDLAAAYSAQTQQTQRQAPEGSTESNTGGDSNEPSGSSNQDQNQAPAAGNASVYDFTKLGVQDEDELVGILGDYKKLKEESRIIEYIKDPFANETIRQINSFSKSTGISDLNLATSIISLSPEDLKANPIKAIAVDMLLSNPKLASVGLEEVMEGVAQKYNVDLDYVGKEGYKYPSLLKMDATSAMESIEEKRSKLLGGEDYFVNLQSQAAKNESERQERLNKWEQALPDVKAPLKALSYSIDTGMDDFGKIDLSVAVSEQEVDQALKSLKNLGLLEGMSPDDKGIPAVRQAVEYNLRLAKMDDIIRESIKAVAGKLQEKMVKDNLNLSPITNQRVAPSPQLGKVTSPAEEALSRFRGGK